ncbi:MAG: hypothetical protein DRN00_03155, partial [Thermoplasmata archaeon]
MRSTWWRIGQMTRIILINPYIFPKDIRGRGRWDSQRPVSPIGPYKVMNFGLLSLASFLQKHDLEAHILDLYIEGLDERAVVKQVYDIDPALVGISCPSALNYVPTLRIAKVIKEVKPDTFIVVGGQHIAFLSEVALRECSGIDAVCYGEGEITMLQLCEYLRGKRKLSDVKGIAFKHKGRILYTEPSVGLDINALSPIDYTIYPHWKECIPLIEESRGCPYRCEFCSNSNFYNAKIRFKRPETLINDVHNAVQIYGEGVPIVIMCSTFGLNPMFAKKFLRELKRLGYDLRLLASTRVDAPWRFFINYMDGLFDQIRFGLESGSPLMLQLMNKTASPTTYLRLAEKAFREFKSREIPVMVNIILGYCGENPETLMQSLRFLIKNKG